MLRAEAAEPDGRAALADQQRFRLDQDEEPQRDVEVGVQFDSPGGESMKRLRQIIRGVKVSGETLE